MAEQHTPNLARRLKKHITSRAHEFFAVTAPHLELFCEKELKIILPQIETFVKDGGVTFYAKPEALYLANLHLHSATRILMRMGAIKAENFVSFAKKLADIPFELYLRGDTLPKVEVTTHHCRLYHSDAIGDAVLAHLGSLFTQAKPNAGTASARIFVRGVDNEFTLSLDTSGEALYKRGLKTQGGEAPLRETLAYYILRKGGYKGGVLLDPMTGSGTFALEAALIAKNQAPGLARNFAFMQAPFFNAPQWDYFKKQAQLAEKSAPKVPLILAGDKDASALTALKIIFAQNKLEAFVNVVNSDFFGITPPKFFGARPGLIALNPPYGLRLLNKAEAENLYGAVCKKISDNFSGWRYVIVTPNKAWVDIKGVRFNKLFHGGLHLYLAYGKL